jgi:diguanylate cyclase (GGDEF)-like protein
MLDNRLCNRFDRQEVLWLRQEVEKLRQEKQEISSLHQRIAQLSQENQDLRLTLVTAIEHGDAIEAELHKTNQQLRQEVLDNQQTEASLRALLELLQKQKTDLEIVVQTLIEHGDMLDRQWNEKASLAEHLAKYDSLTQIANRRKFDQYLEYQWQQMLRQEDNLAVILCDIDYFKQYNDTYGHPMGDRCLQQVAKILQNVLKRGNDLLARYGGEEFAVILPQTNLVGAIAVGQTMLAAINQAQIPHCRSGVNPHVTVSLGLMSLVPTSQTSPQDMVNQADHFLYLAKRQGRNRMVYSY